LAFQKGFRKTAGETARRVQGQDAEERAPRRHPCQRALQHADAQVALTQLAHDQGGEGPIDSEVGTEQNTADAETGVEEITAGSRRNVERRDRLADERQDGSNGPVPLLVRIDRQVTGLPPRRCPQGGRVHREPLLQLARPARRDQGRTRRAAADVDQETRSVGLRAGAG
jgi:hypothetical protein